MKISVHRYGHHLYDEVYAFSLQKYRSTYKSLVCFIAYGTNNWIVNRILSCLVCWQSKNRIWMLYPTLTDSYFVSVFKLWKAHDNEKVEKK